MNNQSLQIYLKNLTIKKRIIGGYDPEDVVAKMQDLVNMVQENDSIFERRISEITVKNEYLNSELKKTAEKLEKSENMVKDLQMQIMSDGGNPYAYQLNQQVTDLKEKLKQSQAQLKESQEELRNRTQEEISSESSARLREKKVELENRLSEAEQANSSLEKENARLKAELAKLKSQNESMESQNARLTEENTRLNTLQLVSNNAEKMHDLLDSIESAKGELIKQYKVKILKEVEQIRQQKTELEQTNETLRQTIKTLNIQLNASIEEIITNAQNMKSCVLKYEGEN